MSDMTYPVECYSDNLYPFLYTFNSHSVLCIPTDIEWLNLKFLYIIRDVDNDLRVLSSNVDLIDFAIGDYYNVSQYTKRNSSFGLCEVIGFVDVAAKWQIGVIPECPMEWHILHESA